MYSVRVQSASRRKYGIGKLGGSMPVHYKVHSKFKFINGKSQLVSTSIYTTHAPCTVVPYYPYQHTSLIICHIYPTLQDAQSYIKFLHRVYPDSPAPPPLLDGGQINLFSEVSK